MSDLNELNDRYRHLRHELEAAYAARVWDNQRINRIAEEMLPVECALARCQATPPEIGQARGA